MKPVPSSSNTNSVAFFNNSKYALYPVYRLKTINSCFASTLSSCPSTRLTSSKSIHTKVCVNATASALHKPTRDSTLALSASNRALSSSIRHPLEIARINAVIGKLMSLSSFNEKTFSLFWSHRLNSDGGKCERGSEHVVVHSSPVGSK